jgi:hypothetical protein
MKQIFAGLLAVFLLVIAACNNNTQKNQHDHNNMNHDSMNHDKMQEDTMKGMKHDSMSSMNHNMDNGYMASMSGERMASKNNIGDIDPLVKNFINAIIDQYLFVKNKLADDNKTESKTGAAQLKASIKKFDKSFFTAKQKNEFDKYADNINEQLQSVISSKEINSQRVSFSMLSQQVYELVKLFGTNQALYHDHCPMAFDNKGAMWLSETKEIKNPYLGKDMLTCGTMQEIIQ